MAGWTWKHREANRLRNGTYQRLPFDQEGWYRRGPGPKEHYAHISKEDSSKIAFTENEKKGKKDLQVRLRPGRYLKRFYGDILNEDQIRDYATQITSKKKDSEFKIAMTPDEIEHVYRNGPDSCMSYGLSSFDSDIHPVRIYGAGDLGVAYLERQGRITSRVLCWPEKKKYSRIYGDSVRLSAELHERGYIQQVDKYSSSSAFTGARLLKIEQRRFRRNNFVVPYVDYHRTMKEDGDYLVLCDDGPLPCGQTNGLTPVCRGVRCPGCSEFSEDTFVSPHDIDAEWCPDCIENRTWRCYNCKERCGGPRAFNLNGSSRRPVCVPCSEEFFQCVTCNTHSSRDVGETILIRDMNTDEIIVKEMCNGCIGINYKLAWCEYFHIDVNEETSDCGCNTCHMRELEAQGQASFVGMPFETRSRPPVAFTTYLLDNPIPDNAPNVRV